MKKLILYIVLILIIGSTSSSSMYMEPLIKEDIPISTSTTMMLLGVGLLGLSTITRKK